MGIIPESGSNTWMKVRTINCRSALNKSGIGGVDYVINPYVGCAHACLYCYADFMRRFTRHEGDVWGDFVDIKANIVERLRYELLGSPGRRQAFEPRLPGMSPRLTGMSDRARSYTGEILLSSVTDPYQPLEATWRLTRGCLEVLREAESREAGPRDETRRSGWQPRTISILTKSDLVTRDIDILKEFRDCHVGLTITTARDEVAQLFEPGAPVPSKRLAALRALNERGIKTWVFMGPVLPFFSDGLDEMKRLFEAVAAAGTREILVDCMNFYPSVRGRIWRVFSCLTAGGRLPGTGEGHSTTSKGYIRTRGHHPGTGRPCPDMAEEYPDAGRTYPGAGGAYPGAAAYLARVLNDLEGWRLDIRNNATEAAARCGVQVTFAF